MPRLTTAWGLTYLHEQQDTMVPSQLAESVPITLSESGAIYQGVTTMNDRLVTLPQLCREWDESLDGLRLLIRKNASLATLGVRVGPTRAFTQSEAAKIKAVVDGKRKKLAVK